MADIDGSLAPAGTRLSPRRNLGAANRILSVGAGALAGIVGSRRQGGAGSALKIIGAMLVARGVSGMGPITRLVGARPDEEAVADENQWSHAALLSRSVTIAAPRAEVFSRFRDFAAWPQWAHNIRSITPVGPDRLRIVSIDPSGTMEWEADITDDRADTLLAIAAVPDTEVALTARFAFRDAPAGRGTEIHATIAYEPPGGSLGRYAAKLTQREPGIQLRRDLKRFKSLIEAGEIAVNDPQGKQPRA